MNGTDNTTTDQNKTVSKTTEVTEVVTIPDFKGNPEPPRLGSEPLVARRPVLEETSEELATTPGYKSRSGLIKTIIVGVVALVALAILLYSCNGVRDLKKDTASFEGDVTKLQADNKTNKDDIGALKKGVEDLNKKVDPMIENVGKLVDTVDKLNDKVNGKVDQAYVDEQLKKKADKSYVDGANWRISRIEKKIEETRIAISITKEPTLTPPLTSQNAQTSAPVLGKSTHNVIYKRVPIFLDMYQYRKRNP